jgi:hypothetical protein
VYLDKLKTAGKVTVTLQGTGLDSVTAVNLVLRFEHLYRGWKVGRVADSEARSAGKDQPSSQRNGTCRR